MRDVHAEIWFSSCVTLLADPLIDYLRQLEAQGQTHVKVDDDARLLLRDFYKRALGQTSSAGSPGVSQAPASPMRTVAPSQVTQPSLPSAPRTQTHPSSAGVVIHGATEEEKLAGLKKQAENWAPAKALGGLRETMVFSAGNLKADIMLVGEAPGFDEERLLEPFAGKAGQKLDAILRAMGTARKDVYISNIVKFRPQMPNQTTSNRKLSRNEINAWLPIIQAEVQIVSPKVIIALGGAAAQAMLGVESSLGDMRGEFHRYADVPVRVTYHPSYILNDEATSEKRMLWLDMLSVMELLDMPISDKQRGYFAPPS